MLQKVNEMKTIIEETSILPYDSQNKKVKETKQ